MALTVVRDTLPQVGTTYPGSDGKTYERWKITGDASGVNADIQLGGGRVPKSVRLIAGNVSLDDVLYSTSLQPSSSVDVRIVVPATLAADKYFFAEIEVSQP